MKQAEIEITTKEHVLHWIVFSLASFILIAAAGFYYMTTQDSLSEAVANSTKDLKPASNMESSVELDKTSDSDVRDLDTEMNKVSEKSFDDSTLDDNQLGL